MVKKTVKLLLVRLMIFSVLIIATGCAGQSSPIEDFEYEIEDGCIIITGYKGVDREIYVPSKIDSRPVTVIGQGAFSEYDLTTIVLPDSIITIEEDAFSECVCLEKVVLSDSLESIDSYAFHGCSALKKIDFPNSLKDIGEFAFSECESLEEVKLPDVLEHLRNSSFAECYSLKVLKVPDNTNLHIKKHETNHPIAGSFTTFICPLGQVTYSNGDTIEPHSTILSIKKGSSAYEQVIGYERYLVIETR